ncbi:hypothetical protein [Serratia rubidaea]|uniref:hypothetical protein n=1 Tax=Serratia rubidaea TaxID=61652 RepID=UPI00177AB343|nr:hypothetical protein [Serratia rubidaea]MBD8454120.1 hypothetical protein [Serratia rubidaea]
MLISKKSLLALLYLCIAFSLMLIFVGIIFQVLGYWVGGGDQMLGYLMDNLYKVLKTGSVGIGIGFVYWFFYYRKI